MPATTGEVYRDYYRRLHRRLSQYILATMCANRLDFVVIRHSDFMRFLKLKRATKTRIFWMEVDLREHFSGIIRKNSSGVGNYYLSNKYFPTQFDPKPPRRKTSPEQRIASLATVEWDGAIMRLPTEERMREQLALYDAGIRSIWSFKIARNDRSRYTHRRKLKSVYSPDTYRVTINKRTGVVSHRQ